MTNNKLIYKSLFYLTAISISILSLVSLNFNKTEKIANVSFRLDYLFHFLAYFFLALFFILWKHKRKTGKKFFILLISFGIFFSIIFELIQIFLPNRVFNPLDTLSNLIGFFVGIFIFFLLRLKLPKLET